VSQPDPAALVEAARLRRGEGDWGAAEALFREALALEPGHFVALCRYAELKAAQGDQEAVAGLLDQALASHPGSALAHVGRAQALWHLGRSEEALVHLTRACMLNPDLVDALVKRGIVLRELGRPEAALASLDRALALRPDLVEALLHRAAALLELGQAEAALAACDRVLALQPAQAQALLNRGNALMDLHRPLEALEDYERGLAIEPEHAQLLLNQGNGLLALGRSEPAMVCYRRLLERHPDCGDALYNHGLALFRLGRPQEAMDWYERALALDPAALNVWINRAAALLALHRATEALASADRALELRPEHPEALINRGTALLELKRPSAALECYDRLLALQPGQVDALLNRGTALHALGRHREALDSFERALALAPERAGIHSNRLFVLDFLPELSFAGHQRERSLYCAAQTRDLVPDHRPFGNDRDPDRRLVLGYVSADFRKHSAASCFGPVLRRHDPARFRVICYSGVRAEDDWTRGFREGADAWRPIAGLDDAAVAEQIRADAVDILIDLSGHSTGNRLLVFARRPAPVQVTAWGHGGGTGLAAMDYQFTDPVYIPEPVRPLFAEACWDLPCCLTFEAPPGAPEVHPAPARGNGFVTFGSLNRFSRHSPEVLDLWARLLAQVPGSRLLVKDVMLEDPVARQTILDAGARHGVDPGRIELRGATSQPEHLAAYHEVDLVLDTFPHNGGITTWEALWMGVPVLTLAGANPGARLSASILHALDLDAWVTRSPDEYLAQALRWAADPGALDRFRGTIRARILGSAAGNPERYTRAVEAAYLGMWRHWLAGDNPRQVAVR